MKGLGDVGRCWRLKHCWNLYNLDFTFPQTLTSLSWIEVYLRLAVSNYDIALMFPEKLIHPSAFKSLLQFNHLPCFYWLPLSSSVPSHLEYLPLKLQISEPHESTKARSEGRLVKCDAWWVVGKRKLILFRIKLHFALCTYFLIIHLPFCLCMKEESVGSLYWYFLALACSLQQTKKK